MTEPADFFGGLSTVEFLRRHWQKRPLVVRGALADLDGPVSREALLELACAPNVDSRLVQAPRDGGGWNLRRGPFSSEDFARLPHDGWTVLVQEVDRHLPSCAALLERFRFAPNWRMDDVMVSYATDGGGVGPHIDRYDVFLIQTAGRRRWRIATRPRTERLAPDTELPVLAEFSADEEWLLEPGDMLYLPPRVAHEGTAVGECVTCSVGFRVPDPRELCADFLTQLGPRFFDDARYADPDLQLPEKFGEIPLTARGALREAAQRLFTADGAFDQWIGRFVTRPLRDRAPTSRNRVRSVAELWERLARGAELRRSAPSHFAWYTDDRETVQLFVGGENYPLGRGCEPQAELLCGRRRLDEGALRPHRGRAQFDAIVIDVVLRGFLALTDA